MVKSVGKVIGLVFLVMSCVAYGQDDITFHALSSRGVPLEQTTAGSPFYLEIAQAGSSGTMQSPTIAGLDPAAITSRSTRIQSVNGDTHVVYRYEVCLTQPGDYTFGPVQITTGQALATSSVVKVKVLPGSAEHAKQEDATDADQALLRLRCDKSHVVVGEKVSCTLQFIYDDERAEVRNIGVPTIDTCTISCAQGPIADVVREKGKALKSLRWQWSLCPTCSGTLTIPAYRADFTVPQEHDDMRNQFNFFAPFLRSRVQQKRVYSNALSLTVDPLPAHAGAVHAIGSFSSVSAHAYPTVMKEGDGSVLTLTIEGEGDLDAVEVPALEGMPPQLRYYDSKNYCKQTPSGTKKSFEYIVQALEPGAFEIPPQKFVYFDVGARRYKQLTTQPITITILPQQGMVKHEGEQDSAAKTSVAEDVGIILPLCTCWTGRCTEPAIPWWVFVVLAAAPLLIWLGMLAMAVINRVRMARSPLMQKKYAWVQARKELARAQRHHACDAVYAIFMSACAQRLMINPTQVSQDTIDRILKDSGAKEEQIEAWNLFYARMTELVFFKQKVQAPIAQSFFEEAWRWLSFLETRL